MRIIFMGSSEASATALRAILKNPVLKIVGVVTQPDRPSGRSRKLKPCPCKQYALQRKLTPIISPEKVNAPEIVETLRALKPEVIVVVAFGQLLKRELLEMAPHGCINGHFSLLPKFRGAAPVQAAILSGEKETGVTIMQMDKGMDTGDILLQAKEPICSDDDASYLMERLAILGGVTLSKALMLMLGGMLKRIPQSESGIEPSYASKMHKSDGLIDWAKSADYLDRMIRAFDPWPGAYTYKPANRCRPGTTGRFKVLVANRVPVIDEAHQKAEPGTICMISPVGPIVKTGTHMLCLTSVQPEGSRPMDGKAFLNGHQLKIGDRLLSTPPECINA